MEIYNSLQYVLENDPEPLCMNFSVSNEVLGQVCVQSFPGENMPTEGHIL